MIDANSGRELYGVNEDAPRHPASITKVMTLYLLFEQLEKGRIALDTPLQVSAHAAGQSPTKLGVPAGSTVPVEIAIKAIVTRSANDMAVTVAENLAGDELTFARLMTEKAHALGMRHTFYHNASGLPDMRQITTARDLTVLGRAIHDRFPRYYRYFSTPSFVYRGETIGTHNHLMARMQGMDGIKTGYTNASGFNLLSSVQRGNRHVVAVVMGGKSAASRDNVMEGLLQSHFEEAQAGPSTRVAEGGPVEEAAETPRRAAPAPEPVERAAPEPPRRPMAQVADGDDDAAENAAEDADPAPPLPPARSRSARAAPRGPSLIAPEMAVPVPERAPERLRLARSPGEHGPADRARPAFIAGGAPRSARRGPTCRRRLDQSPNRAVLRGRRGRRHRDPLEPALGDGPAARAARPGRAGRPIRREARGGGSVRDDLVQRLAGRPHRLHPGAARPHRGSATGPRGRGRPRRGGPGRRRPPRDRNRPVMIQVGATADAGSAAELLSRARSEGRSALASAKPFTEKVQRGDSTLYRARFAGLEPAEAEAACRALKRSGFACFATRD